MLYFFIFKHKKTVDKVRIVILYFFGIIFDNITNICITFVR